MRVFFYLNNNSNNINFDSKKANKLIQKIDKTENLKNLKITFQELVSMHNEIGYDVFFKRGSHAVVHLTENVNIPIVIPHKTKNAHLFDLKRFKYVLAGEIKKAMECT